MKYWVEYRMPVFLLVDSDKPVDQRISGVVLATDPEHAHIAQDALGNARIYGEALEAIPPRLAAEAEVLATTEHRPNWPHRTRWAETASGSDELSA
ncbi:hypothetical protein ABT324_32395 [Saccharopolyspora sp. NPDC000359]|uniref:hypothetical protein n=1 Tax=Saccharopolyspora sp. NPDC000359 TaxID=3154251 RepID=UPI00331E573B